VHAELAGSSRLLDLVLRVRANDASEPEPEAARA
jgi:hypothetical protein